MAKPFIELTTTDAQFQREVNKALKVEIDSYMRKVARAASSPMRTILNDELRKHPTVQSVAHGDLRGHFGLVDGADRIGDIIDFWVSGLEVKVSRTKVSAKLLTSSLQITAIRSSYNDVLTLPASSFATEKGEVLPWLEWLLLHGDKEIIQNYHINVTSGRISTASRTGQAVMDTGGRWGVPSAHSGTQDHNFATEAVDNSQAEIIDILEKIMKTTVA